MFKTLSRLIYLRKFGRLLGINKIIFQIFYKENDYEMNFNKYFSNKILKNFCIYDIGANIGYYSIEYSRLVGLNGKIIAFEPSIVNYQNLLINIKGQSNIQAVNIGLGEKKEKLFLCQGEDELGATSILSNHETNHGSWVDIIPLDEVINYYPFPNALKIDVEGFEYDVLSGAKETLRNTALKVVGVEVHFSILEERRILNVITKIEELLKSSGFIVKWTDFSHFIAFRK